MCVEMDEESWYLSSVHSQALQWEVCNFTSSLCSFYWAVDQNTRMDRDLLRVSSGGMMLRSCYFHWALV